MNNRIKEHPILVHANDIADICRPLHHLNITYFCHVRIDNNEKFSAIANNPQFAEHYLKNKYYNADIHMDKDNSLGNMILWDAIPKCGETEELDVVAAAYNVRHTFTLIENNVDSRDYYHFSTHLDDWSINQIYLSNLDLLKKFIHYFKVTMRHSRQLSNAYQWQYGIDDDASGFSIQDNYITESANVRGEFLHSLSSNKPHENEIVLLRNNSEELLTLAPQQSKCLLLLAKGLSCKEIALQLNLSYRTVEFYLRNLRKSLGYRNSKEMIAAYFSQNK